MEKKKERLSGIELLKIIAIVLIVISHVTQTLETGNQIISNNVTNYTINLKDPTSSINNIVLAFIRQFGALGNMIFLISSIWFLIDKNKNYKKKILSIIIDIFIISVASLLLFMIFYKGDISIKYIIKSIFPTIFANNWYMTCYIMLLLLYPFLNIIVKSIDKKQLFRINLLSIIVYFGICFVKTNLLFNTSLVVFVVIYFLVAYIRKYCINFVKDKKANIILLILSVVISIASLIVLNYIELKSGIKVIELIKFATNNNILLLITGFSLFNLFLNINISNKVINYISSLSMLIYVIHENILVRVYLRPQIWSDILNKYGEKYIIIEDLLFSIMILFASLIIAIIYKNTIQKIVIKIIDYLYNKSMIKKCYLKIEEKILNKK